MSEQAHKHPGAILSWVDRTITTKRVRHTPCGYELIQVDAPELYDVTSLGDVPKELKGISWDSLPQQYHKYIVIGTLTHWQDHGIMTWECPQCGASLSAQTVVEIGTEQANGVTQESEQ